MSRKRCIRKVWRTGPGFNPVAHAIGGVTGITEAEQEKLRSRELAAIAGMASSHARDQEWAEIDAMVSLMEVLAEDGVGIEGIEAAKEARQHLDGDYLRWIATGRMGTAGPGLKAYRAAYEIHDLQRQCATRSQYEKAITLAMARTRQRHKALQALEATQKESATHG